MVSPSNAGQWADPQALMQAALSFRDAEAPGESADSTLDEAIRSAHQLVSPDLYVIERLKQAGMAIDYAGLFGVQLQEKIAALVFLTKHKLLDIEFGTLQSRDLDDARKDLSAYVEILFHLKAVAALGIFFDFAIAQHNSRVPWLWQNVSSRCLYLMAMLPECREEVYRFLDERPQACKILETLCEAIRPELARNLLGLLRDYKQQPLDFRHEDTDSVDIGQPLYVTLYHQYASQSPPGVTCDSAGVGLSSLLSAQDRVQQAASSGDIPALVDWISHGSADAMKSALQQAVSLMPTLQYVEMLDRATESTQAEPVRLTVVVLELGKVNRMLKAQGGVPQINQTLTRLALTNAPDCVGVAKIAVRELASVRSFPDLHKILEHAPMMPVAEEVIFTLRDLRHLAVSNSLLVARPVLQQAYQSARRDLMELHELADAASACQSEEMARIYLEQLKARHAMPELRQLILAQSHVSTLAAQILDEMIHDNPLTLYN